MTKVEQLWQAIYMLEAGAVEIIYLKRLVCFNKGRREFEVDLGNQLAKLNHAISQLPPLGEAFARAIYQFRHDSYVAYFVETLGKLIMEGAEIIVTQPRRLILNGHQMGLPPEFIGRVEIEDFAGEIGAYVRTDEPIGTPASTIFALHGLYAYSDLGTNRMQGWEAK
jgi:hypothetical protein